MTSLIINGLEAILPTSLNVQLVIENPYFTKAYKYSLDIDLPMPENHHIFGHINRLDVTKKYITFPTVLYAGRHKLLDGIAVVLAANSGVIRIQLLSGNSEFNFLTNDDIYIDELELGRATMKSSATAMQKEELFAGVDSVDYIFPYVSVEDRIINDVYHLTNHGYYAGSRSSYESCPQFFLARILERIIKTFDYNLGDNFLTETWMKNIIIVSAARFQRNGVEISKILPHWTISQFLDEIERFAGVITVVNELDKTVSFVDLNDYFNTTPYYINEILDEFESEIHELPDKEDITQVNVGYKLPSITDDGYNRLPSDLFDIFNIYEGNRIDDLYTRWSNDSEETKCSRLYQSENRTLINYKEEEGSSNTLREVNLYAHLIRDSSSSDEVQELNIVPAQVKVVDVGLWESDGGSRYNKVASLYTNIPISSYSPGYGGTRADNVQAFIEEGDPRNINKSPKEILEVALYTGLSTVSSTAGTTRLPIPFMDYRVLLEGQITQHLPYSLSLNNVADASMGNRHISLKKISSQVEYIIRFVSDVIPSISNTFVLNNKKYLAKKLEISIDVNGMLPIIEGTFYRID